MGILEIEKIEEKIVEQNPNNYCHIHSWDSFLSFCGIQIYGVSRLACYAKNDPKSGRCNCGKMICETCASLIDLHSCDHCLENL